MLASFAAVKKAGQSRPGAFRAKSARRQWTFPFVTSQVSSRVQCTAAIFVSSRRIASAWPSASAKPASVSIFAT